jgi:hypothetical protein
VRGTWGRWSRRPAAAASSRAPCAPQDEQSTLQLLKKHLQLEQGVENYEESIAQLSRQCRALLEMGHPDRWAGRGHEGAGPREEWAARRGGSSKS